MLATTMYKRRKSNVPLDQMPSAGTQLAPEHLREINELRTSLGMNKAPPKKALPVVVEPHVSTFKFLENGDPHWQPTNDGSILISIKSDKPKAGTVAGNWLRARFRTVSIFHVFYEKFDDGTPCREYLFKCWAS